MTRSARLMGQCFTSLVIAACGLTLPHPAAAQQVSGCAQVYQEWHTIYVRNTCPYSIDVLMNRDGITQVAQRVRDNPVPVSTGSTRIAVRLECRTDAGWEIWTYPKAHCRRSPAPQWLVRAH